MRLIAIGVVLGLMSVDCHAQAGPSHGQCEQVRAAAAQYGLQAARQHAMQNYGLSPTDLCTIEQGCGIGGGGGDRGRQLKSRPVWG
jgi:hypothetical protein